MTVGLQVADIDLSFVSAQYKHCTIEQFIPVKNLMTELWKPRLTEGNDPAYKRLLSALQQDIDRKTVSAGTRLPPVRETAFQLKLSAGTVARAYRDAEQMGLTEAAVGRGTFVASPRESSPLTASESPIDLSQNLPPIMLSGAAVAQAATAFHEPSPELRRYSYGPHNGFPAQREQFTAIARKRLPNAQVDNLVITNGGQHGIFLALATLCQPGDIVLCENLTFNGIKAVADMLKLKLVGIEMDDEGLQPEALGDAARATGAKVLYTIPTSQNPTGRTQSVTRRRDIAEICDTEDITIVEADMYAFMMKSPPPPLAHLVPHRTFYLDSFSKRISPSLRTGILVCPPQHVARAQSVIRATSWMSSPLTAAITAQLHRDGTADKLTSKIRHETSARATMASRFLRIAPINENALQVWLDMPLEYALKTEIRAKAMGVLVTPIQVPGVAGHDGTPPPTGLRICLGGPETRAELAEGLKRLIRAMEPDPHEILSLV